MNVKCKVIYSWYEFVSTLKKQFYPLGYKQQAMMEWKNYRQGKGQSVQDYTQEFRKKDLVLGIPLCTQEIVLKYIGGLLSYLRHTIIMFNQRILSSQVERSLKVKRKAINHLP